MLKASFLLVFFHFADFLALKETAYFTAMAYQMVERAVITNYLKKLNAKLNKAAKEGAEKEIAEEKVCLLQTRIRV